MFAEQKKSTEAHHLPCQIGKVLCEVDVIKSLLVRVKSLVSCPLDIYQKLYLATLTPFAEFCQAMPYAEQQYSQAYGLIERQLLLVEATLKLRRGLLLPKNSDSETIAAAEARWTYALFSASLFHDIYHVQHDRTITLSHQNGEKISEWSPLSGSLYESGAYYQSAWVSKSNMTHKDVFMAALAGRIVPAIAFRWLESDKLLFPLWWQSILQVDGEQNDLIDIITTAANKAQMGMFLKDVVATTPSLPIHLVEWLTKAVKIAPEGIFKFDKGLFVSDLHISQYLSDHSACNEANVISEMEKSGWLIKNSQGDYYHMLSPKKFEDRQVIKGLCLNDKAVPFDTSHLPINNHYQENIIL